VPTQETARVPTAHNNEQPVVLFVNAHYRPDVAATASPLTDLAEYLATAGYRVEVCTGQANYLAANAPAPPLENRNGVQVMRVRTTRFGRGRFFGRVADYASFHWHVLRLLLFSNRYTHVVFLTTPPFLHVVGWFARTFRDVRYAVWSMDLHPAAEFTAGVIQRDRLVGQILFRLHVAAHGAADFIVALGPYMRDRLIADGLDASRIECVPVWVDTSAIMPARPAFNPLAASLGLENRFVVAYAGNAGIVHEFDAMLEAMRLLADDDRIRFLVVGAGPRRGLIDRFVASHGLTNVVLRGYIDDEYLHQLQALIDVHLVTLAPAFVGVSVPFKCYVAMATGRPVLFIGPERCETADAIRDAGAGACVTATQADAGAAVAAILRRWSESPAETESIGARAREAAVAHYDRQRCCASFEAVLRSRWPEVAPRDVG
jgi:colanic acid biosynthesis glycosyl transferase WcaI